MNIGKQKKARKYATMERIDSNIERKKEKKDPSTLKEREKSPNILPAYSSNITHSWAHLTTSCTVNDGLSVCQVYACITECVMAETEKLGQKYRVALRITKDPRLERLPCTHKRTYADEGLVQRVTQHECYIVATVDWDLTGKILKIPGVPNMYISFLFFFFFFYLFMIVTERERERGRDIGRGRSRLHALGARRGIRSRVSRITPWAKGRRQTTAPPRDPNMYISNHR
ncbi:unnamed protein product [Nyctereutes procyonoides]|uniref:(raccoon dog) hypothetical protein n=1 Tax=Nyctereutes procyonoides TaxID=34880 RepID=A0A811ZFV8_NYCPR|nr:unnamed protein product [Nyctereutes procyonoides]